MYCVLQTTCRRIKLGKPPPSVCILQAIRFTTTSSKNSVKADPRPELKVTATTVHTYDKPLQRKHVKSGALDPVLVPGGVAIETNKRRKDAKVIPEPDWREIRLDWKQLPSSYLKLSKARLTTLVVLTSMAGYAMAPAPFEWSSFLICSLGTGLVSSAANAVNQYHEVPFDSQMSRTKNRVLVRGVLSPLHALGFALASSAAGTAMLYFGVNGLTAALGLFNMVLYTSVYTPMKRISIANTWVGSVVGAIPPLMGWAACTGSLLDGSGGAFLLSAILFTWQFPHFNALSWNLRPDYSRAGYRMMAVTNPDLCRLTSLRYTVALLVVSAAGPLLDVTNVWFALESIPLNAYFTYLAYKFYKESDSSSSRKLFRFSLLHLPALMILLLINKKHWASHGSDAAKDSIEVSVQPSIDSLITPPNPATLGLKLGPVIETS
ncbi:protoheme IX farnesyltransferase, mitochondrial isoform X1 [Diaphorina citri]|uniref:Protoheme IX farnesyltransferase, mitochondrial n=1 Tax=Diaphorina citri TaxID=121845 RepID=A0A3Q0IMS8_DIACI|nr:protoheme IX farnesyltransferase, mitochondrial isoform X1 [Diaphorina citri]